MKKLIPIVLIILLLVVAATPPRIQDRSCEWFRAFHAPRLLMQCLLGSR